MTNSTMQKQINAAERANFADKIDRRQAAKAADSRRRAASSGARLGYAPKLDAVEITVFSDMVAVKVKGQAAPTKTSPGRSGRPITSFTAKSRLNMLRKLAQLRDVTGGYFVTLTYPGQFFQSPDRVKENLFALRKALQRAFPEIGVFWRMELKKRLSGASRGEIAPHFHLLAFGAGVDLAEFDRVLREAWFRITGDGSQANFENCVDVREMNTRKHAALYCAKYSAKMADTDSTLVLYDGWMVQWGRHWGYFGNLNFEPLVTITISMEQLVNFKRLTKRWLKKKAPRFSDWLRRSDKYSSFSVLGLGGQSCECWGDLFHSTVFRMILDAPPLPDLT